MKVMLKFVLVSALCQLALGAGWTYDAKEDADWKGTCKTGTQQSPVTLDGVADANKKAKNAEGLEAAYTGDTGAVFYNNGHGFQVEPAAGKNLGTVKYGLKTYNAIQYHFHFPSEHATKDGLATGEVHVVHQADGTNDLSDLLVIGRFLKSGDTESAWLKSIGWTDNITALTEKRKYEDKTTETTAAKCEQGTSGNTSVDDCALKIATTKDKATCDAEGDGTECKFTEAETTTTKVLKNAATSQAAISGEANTSDFIKLDTNNKVDGNYWRYEGSLTTPTCDESVHWFVLEDPEPISTAQAKAFTDAFNNTNRPLQDIVCNAEGVKELYYNTLNVARLDVPSTPVVIGDCKPKADTPAATVVTGTCEDADGKAIADEPADGWTEEACKKTEGAVFTATTKIEDGKESGASQVGFSVLLLAMLALFN